MSTFFIVFAALLGVGVLVLCLSLIYGGMMFWSEYKQKLLGMVFFLTAALLVGMYGMAMIQAFFG